MDKYFGVDTFRAFVGPPKVEGDQTLSEIVLQFYADSEWQSKPVYSDVLLVSEEADYSEYASMLAFPQAESSTVHGKCFIFSNSDGTEAARYVALLEDYWMKATYDEQKILVYHLMGHCAMGLADEAAPPAAVMAIPLPDEELTPDLVYNFFVADQLKVSSP